MKKKYNGRIYDSKTCTYSFFDGSGLITEEQQLQRNLIKSKIEELEYGGASPIEICAYKWAYLFWK